MQGDGFTKSVVGAWRSEFQNNKKDTKKAPNPVLFSCKCGNEYYIPLIRHSYAVPLLTSYLLLQIFPLIRHAKGVPPSPDRGRLAVHFATFSLLAYIYSVGKKNLSGLSPDRRGRRGFPEPADLVGRRGRKTMSDKAYRDEKTLKLV